MSFEAFTTVMFQVEVFWVATLCSVVAGYTIQKTSTWNSLAVILLTV